MLSSWIRSKGGDTKAALFVSSRLQPLTRFGIYKLVRRHTQDLVRSDGHDPGKTVSPHVFRHTTAVRLLESGVEINVIRGWLGHVSLDTTNRYAEITMRTKEEALAACMPPTTSGASPPRVGWRQDQDLMKWLQSQDYVPGGGLLAIAGALLSPVRHITPQDTKLRFCSREQNRRSTSRNCPRRQGRQTSLTLTEILPSETHLWLVAAAVTLWPSRPLYSTALTTLSKCQHVSVSWYFHVSESLLE